MKPINVPEETYTNLTYIAGKLNISPTTLLIYCIDACSKHPEYIGRYITEQLKEMK